MTTLTAATLRNRYERNPGDVFHAGWTFSWWRHGGEPGPDWLSDKVDIAVAGGQVTGTYTRARNAPRPPFQTTADEFTGTLPAPLAEQLLRSIFTTQIFERSLPSEARANLADAIKQEFELRVGSTHLSKTLHEPAPEELGDLGPACDAVAAHLRDTGTHRDVTRK
jgi:hypothetical protein